jgi:serine protease Do
MVGLSTLQPVAALTPAELFARVSPAVWMVQADHAAPGAGAGGSAVAIDARTLATNAHVVNGATTIRVSHDAGKTIIPVVQVTRDPDPARDLCLLAVSEDLPGEPVTIAPAESVAVGGRVYAIGAPLGLELSLTEGLVSALRDVVNEPLQSIQFSAATAPGSSGGGLFDDCGRLIGLTSAIAAKENESLGFAHPAQWIGELMPRVEGERTVWAARLTANGVLLGADGLAAPSGFAELSDLTRIPLGDRPAKEVTDAYRQFLLLARPRAFVLTSDGRWGAIAAPTALDALIAECAAGGVQCQFYAIDDAVVWPLQAG